MRKKRNSRASTLFYKSKKAIALRCKISRTYRQIDALKRLQLSASDATRLKDFYLDTIRIAEAELNLLEADQLTAAALNIPVIDPITL